MLTPAKHRNHIRASFVLEQSRAPSRSAMRWAPYASRWTLVFRLPLNYEIMSQFCSHKKQRNAVINQALSITYSLNPLLHLSAFLGCWMCIVSRSEKMPCVTLYTSLCFKPLLPLLPEAVAQNCGLLKNYFNTAEAKSQEMGPCSRSKAPSPSHHPCDTLPEWAIFFLCPSPAFNCASLQNIHPQAPIFICSVSGKPSPWPGFCSAMWVLCVT